MKSSSYGELVLAIRPTHRGFAYAVFEAPLSPVDWGMTEVSGTNKSIPTRDAVLRLCRQYQPDTLVIENRTGSAALRSSRVRELTCLLVALAKNESIHLARYSRTQIRQAFHHEKITRYDIALAIAALIPALQDRLPPPRKVWNSEDPRLWIFDAASLAMTHLAAIVGDDPP